MSTTRNTVLLVRHSWLGASSQECNSLPPPRTLWSASRQDMLKWDHSSKEHTCLHTSNLHTLFYEVWLCRCWRKDDCFFSCCNFRGDRSSGPTFPDGWMNFNVEGTVSENLRAFSVSFFYSIGRTVKDWKLWNSTWFMYQTGKHHFIWMVLAPPNPLFHVYSGYLSHQLYSCLCARVVWQACVWLNCYRTAFLDCIFIHKSVYPGWQCVFVCAPCI